MTRTLATRYVGRQLIPPCLSKQLSGILTHCQSLKRLGSNDLKETPAKHFACCAALVAVLHRVGLDSIMEKQAPGSPALEIQNRMMTLRLTPTQYSQLVKLATKAREQFGFSCNTWILVQLGIVTTEDAIEHSRKRGLPGRKMSLSTSQKISGANKCEAAN